MKRKQTKKSQQKGRWKAIQLVLKNIEWPDQLSMKRQGNCKSTYLWRWVHILYIHLNTNLFKRGEGIEVNSPFLFIKAKLPARTEHHQEKKKMNINFFFSGFFFPIASIGKFTAMIILHFHLQQQFKYELFHILHIISLLTGDMNSTNWPRSQCVAS